MCFYPLLLVFALHTTSSLPTIRTSPPLPRNIVATGFSGLTLGTRFERNDSECRWNLEKMYSKKIFDQNQVCLNTNDVTCSTSIEAEKNFVYTTLTINSPITSNLSVAIACTSMFVTEELKVQVQDCSIDDSLLKVSSMSSSYNSIGEFYCQNGGTLVNQNNGKIASNSTVCLGTAQWDRANELQCWYAPTTTLNGDLSVLEGESVSVTCDYDDVYPQGNQSIFYYGDVEVVLEKNQQFTIPKIKRSDNRKPIFCKALTVLTERFSNAGRSAIRYINVTYAPYQNSPTKCNWFQSQTQLCNVSFFASTNVELVNVQKNGRSVDGVISQISILSEDVATFYYAKENVDLADAGSYEIAVSFPIPPYKITLGFEVEITKQLPVVQRVVGKLWIALICVAVYGLLLTLTAFCLCSKIKNIRQRLQGETDYEQPFTNSAYDHAKVVNYPGNKMNPSSSFQKRGGSGSDDVFSSTIHETSPKGGIEFMASQKTEYEEIFDPPLNSKTSPRHPPPGYEIMAPRSPRPSKENIVSYQNFDTDMTKV